MTLKDRKKDYGLATFGFDVLIVVVFGIYAIPAIALREAYMRI